MTRESTSPSAGADGNVLSPRSTPRTRVHLARRLVGVSRYPLVLLTAIYAINQAHTFLLSSLFPLIKQEFQLSDTTLGLLGGSYLLMLTVGSVPFGVLADRYTRTRIIAWGTVAWGLAMILTGSAFSFIHLLIARALLGLADPADNPTSQSLLADYYPVSQRGKVMGIYQIGGILGVLFLPIAGGMAEAWGWRAAFYLFAIPGFAVALLAWHLREPERGLQDRRHQNLEGAPARESAYERLSTRRAYREIVRIPTYTIALVSSGVSSFFLGGISVWSVTFLIREHDMSVSQASAALGLFALGALVGSIAAGFAADRLVARGITSGRIYVAGVLRLVTFATLFPAFATANTAVMLILFTLGAAALTGAQPVLNAVRADILHPKLRGRGNALDSVTQNMAEAASPILFGFFSDLISLRAAFLILVPLMLFGGLLLLALGPRFYPRDEEAMLRQVVDEGEPGGRAAAHDGAGAAPRAAEALLDVRGVDFSYGPLQVLFDVTLNVPSGASVALLGPNGAGKTTLLKCISGHLEPEAGSVRFGGIDLSGVPPEDRVRLGITLIAGGRSTFPTLSVGENLWMGAYPFTRSRRLVEDRLGAILDIFPALRPRLTQAAGTLSGGEQQMMALGRALMAGPRLLLVDELSMGLAPVVTDELLGVVEQIGGMGTTMLIVEQSVNVALRVGDQIYFMEKGEARYLGTRAALRRKKGDLGRLMVLGRGSG